MKLSSLINYLLAGFAVVILLAAVAFGFQMKRVLDNEAYEAKLFHLDNQLTVMAGVQTELLLDCNERARKQWLILHARISNEIDELLERFEGSTGLGQSLRESHSNREQALSLICQGPKSSIFAVDPSAERYLIERLSVIKLIVETQRSSLKVEQLHGHLGAMKTRELDRVSAGYIALWVMIGVLVVTGYFLLRRHVIYPLNQISTMVTRFGQGDFEARTAVHRPDEIGKLADALDAMASNVVQLTVSTAKYSQEVSERRRTEKELLFLLDRYRLIMEGSGHGIWDWDVVNKTVEYSSAWKSMRGYQDDEIGDYEAEWVAGIHPDDKDRVFGAIQNLFDSNDNVFDQEYRVRRKDGSWLWIRDIGAIRRNEHGQVVRMAGSEFDITDLKLEAMREQVMLNLTQSLLDEATDLAIYDKVVENLQASSDFPIAALELYDAEREEMVFVACRGVPSVEPNMRVPTDQTLSGLVVKQTAALLETNALACEGYRYEALRALQVVSFVCVPLKLTNGKILGTLSLADPDPRQDLPQVQRILSEIAERLAAGLDIRSLRDEAQRNAEKIALIFQNLSEGLYYVDSDGHVIGYNPAACRLFGLSKAEFAERRVDDAAWQIIDEAGRHMEPHEFPAAQALATGEPVFSQVLGVYMSSCEDYVWMHFNAIPLFRSGDKRPSEVFVTIHDVNERLQKERQAKKMQASLMQAQKMQSVGLLTGGIAHDFNNLLGIILGNLELLEDDLSGNDQAARRAQSMRQSANRAVELVRQLLGFSRQKPAHAEACSINALLEDIDQLVQRAGTPAVNIRWLLGRGLWMSQIDPGDFQDVVLNLAANARDAMPRGGELVIETSNTELDEDFCRRNSGAMAGQYVKLVVSDNGVGIEQEHLQKVFEPFYTSKAVGKGTGLGLAMVYGFTKRSDGYILAESTPGQGACFSLFLPRANVAEARAKLAKPAKPTEALKRAELSRGKGTVLVVDDEDQLRELAKDRLEALGYRVLLASSAEQALAVLANDAEIDLLFSDVVMPGGMDGLDLSDKVRSLYPSVKVLLTSGYNNKILKEGTRAEGFPLLLAKPYNGRSLAEQVQKLLAGRDRSTVPPRDSEFDWRDELLIGVDSMDAEHREILALHKQLAKSIRQQQHADVIASVEALADSIRTHFANEESLMQSCHYPGLQNHQEVHQMLLKRIDALRNSALSDQLTETAVGDFLNNWWIDHSEGMDRAYVPYIHAHAKKATTHEGDDELE